MAGMGTNCGALVPNSRCAGNRARALRASGHSCVPEDVAATVDHLVASETLFRTAVAGYLLRQVVLALLVMVVYKLFKQVDINVAGVMLVFALISISLNMLNELNYLAALQLAVGAVYVLRSGKSGARSGSVVPENARLAQPPGHTFPLDNAAGIPGFRSCYVPRVLGIWLIIGGFAYAAQAITLVIPSFDATILGLFAFGGEVVFWLLIKGVKTA